MAAPYAGAGRDRMTEEREALHRRAYQRSREERWNAPGRSRVVHPKYGSVVVPHSSNLTALLNAAEYDMEAVALEWKYADFLEQQKLCRIDHTLSFCYVILQEAEDQSRTGVYLSALTAQQKCQLWRTFLEKGLPQPEFEWLRNALLQGDIPNWIEWHLALYRVLEELGIRFLCRDGQFVLLDRQGKKLYFGIDHGNSAAQVLMKVLFPLRR